MSEAIKLKIEYQRVRKGLSNTKDHTLRIQLSHIEKEIRFHAKLSGNEPLFLQEIWNN